MTEYDLLRWLSREDWSLYGECKGNVLDRLLQKGLVRYAHYPPDDRTGVQLTDAGREALLP